MYIYSPLYNCLDLTRVGAFCQWGQGSLTRRKSGGIRINNRKVVRRLSGEKRCFWRFYKPENLTNQLNPLMF